MRRTLTLMLGLATSAIVMEGQGTSTAYASEYKTTEDCILDRMKGVTSDVAAKAIIAACRKITTPKAATSCTPRPLVKEEAALEGTIDFGYSLFKANIYNPNKTLTIRRLVVTVDFTMKDGSKTSRTYSDNVFIKPLSTGLFQVETEFTNDRLKDVQAQIEEVYGCEQE